MRIAKATQVGRWNKVQALQRLLTRSHSGKLLAVKRVTENAGKKTVAKGQEVKFKVAQKALQNFKADIRKLTRRSGGRSMDQWVSKLMLYLLGWKAYFGLAQTPGVWRELDNWLRPGLRATQLKNWKRPSTIYRALSPLGAQEDVAKRVTAYSLHWCRNSAMLLNSVLTISYFDRLGVCRLS